MQLCKLKRRQQKRMNSGKLMRKWRKLCHLILAKIGQHESVIMVKHEITIITDNDQPLTLDELCEICHISSDVVSEFIAYEIIHPKSAQRDQWVFNLNELKRVQTALRLQHDLEVNLA